MTPIEGTASTTGGMRERVMGCFRCDGCSALNIAIGWRVFKDKDPLDWLASGRNLEWQPVLPKRLPEHTFADVPPAIAAVASEAYRCLELANARRAAVLMARGVIEATAKDKGINKGKLLEKIDTMTERGLIRPNVRDGAHEVRYFGNDMAHGDFGQDVRPEDARLVLALMAEVLEEVYRAPARVESARAAREERKRQQQRLEQIMAGSVQGSPAMTDMIQSYLKSQAAKPITIPTPISDNPDSGNAQPAQ